MAAENPIKPLNAIIFNIFKQRSYLFAMHTHNCFDMASTALGRMPTTSLVGP
jgi:hypothetical protein